MELEWMRNCCSGTSKEWFPGRESTGEDAVKTAEMTTKDSEYSMSS